MTKDTNNYGKIIEGGPEQEMKIEELDELLNKTFAFYSEFFRVLEGWHYEAAKMPRSQHLREQKRKFEHRCR